ncbi:hypothetical protein IG631_09361 [Alternaria alternata]|nr:hypothetical protein IG631_09361 [Alternaria alternata]
MTLRNPSLPSWSLPGSINTPFTTRVSSTIKATYEPSQSRYPHCREKKTTLISSPATTRSRFPSTPRAPTRLSGRSTIVRPSPMGHPTHHPGIVRTPRSRSHVSPPTFPLPFSAGVHQMM